MGRVNLIGKTFGLWTVISFAGSANRKYMWNCTCVCGRSGRVASSCLICGSSTNCGCVRKVKLGLLKTKHGMEKKPEYQTWKAMKARCMYQRHASYKNYGGRGISVCERWRNDFAAFYFDIGPRPSPQHSVERRDNDGNYEPSNCYWATTAEQQANKRDNHRITYNGQTNTLSQWSQITGLDQRRIGHRIKAGWTIERALTTPSSLKMQRLFRFGPQQSEIDFLKAELRGRDSK